MRERQELGSLLERRYGTPGATVEPLPGSWEGTAHTVLLPDGRRWVLRTYPGTSMQGNRDVAVFSFLARQRYPAPRLVPALDGSPMVVEGDMKCVVATFIDGHGATYAPDSLYSLGAAVGRLHSLVEFQDPSSRFQVTGSGTDASKPRVHMQNYPRGTTLPVADMLPAKEVAWALDLLKRVERRIPPSLRPCYDVLTTGLRAIRNFDELPVTLIHNDCHPGNAITRHDGSVVLIDWQGAGLGPPIVDLGFLLISCDTESPWTPPLPPDPRRVTAVVDGYCQHRIPTRAELTWLPDAMRFRSLVYGAEAVSRAVQEGQDGVADDWWWTRYEAADDVATRAQACIETYR